MENGVKVIKENNRVVFLDYLRTLAAFCVVFIHVSARAWEQGTVLFSAEWYILTIFTSISRWAVPVFVMISGSLLLAKESFSVKEALKRCKRILIAFLVWSFIYAILFHHDSLWDFFSSLIGGHYHLWYCWLIMGLYLVTPILKELVRDEKLTRYFLILSAVFAFVLPEVVLIGSYISKPLVSLLASSFSYVMMTMRIEVVGAYGFYYVLGYYLRTHSFEQKVRVGIYAAGICSVAFTFITTILACKHNNAISADFIAYESVQTALIAVAIFVFAKQHFDKENRVISVIAKYSFGIYLSHLIAVEVLQQHIMLNIYEPVKVIIFTVLSFAVAFAISWVVRKLPGGKYIS